MQTAVANRWSLELEEQAGLLLQSVPFGASLWLLVPTHAIPMTASAKLFHVVGTYASLKRQVVLGSANLYQYVKSYNATSVRYFQEMPVFANLCLSVLICFR